MRLSLFASLAAVAAASDSSFDDDDLNFLRLLSSNASSNATTVAATSAPNTTTMAPNTTVAATQAPNTTVAATTVAATTVAGNTTATTVAATEAATTVASGNVTEAATTVAATTVVEETEAPGTMAPATELCLKANYAALGMSAPATLVSTQNIIGIKCDAEGLDGSTEEKSVLHYGVAAQAEANLAKCTGAETLTCGSSTILAQWNSMSSSDGRKGAILASCCGYPANFEAQSLKADDGLFTTGTLTYGIYTAAGCAVADAKATTKWADQQGWGATIYKVFTLGVCNDLNYVIGGGGHKITAHNTTSYISERHFNTQCTALMSAHVEDQVLCTENVDDRRRLGEHLTNETSAPGTEYMERKLTAGSGGAITELEVVAAATLGFATLPAVFQPGSDESAALVATTSETVRAEVHTAGGSVGVTSIISSVGTGVLAEARRRLSARRLGGHEVGSVETTTKTTVPVAQAQTVKTAVEAATQSTGSLGDAAQLGAAVLTAVAADSTLAAVASNITQPSVAFEPIGEPVIPSSPTGTTGGSGAGTTSGAVSEYLSVASGAFLCLAALLM